MAVKIVKNVLKICNFLSQWLAACFVLYKSRDRSTETCLMNKKGVASSAKTVKHKRFPFHSVWFYLPLATSIVFLSHFRLLFYLQNEKVLKKKSRKYKKLKIKLTSFWFLFLTFALRPAMRESTYRTERTMNWKGYKNSEMPFLELECFIFSAVSPFLSKCKNKAELQCVDNLSSIQFFKFNCFCYGFRDLAKNHKS